MIADSPGQPRPRISVVVPAYNEEATLPALFDALAPVLDEAAGGAWEILVVDDGSRDRTSRVAREYGDPRVTCLRLEPNQGKGAAVRAGMLASRGDAVLLTDADMSTPPSFLLPFLDALRAGADIAIGNRKDPRSRITRKQSFARRFLGRGFILLSRLLTGTRLSDFNCGFKLFRGDAARAIFRDVETPRWGYDLELLAIAVRSGYRVVELPVEWQHGDGSCVRLPGAIFQTLGEMARIRARLKRSAAASG